MRNLLILLFGCICFFCQAQSAHSHLREGDLGYRTNEFDKAEESYRRSLLEESSTKGKYNLANSVYQQERYDEAIKYYNEALGSTTDNKIKANAFHNLGNAHFAKEEFDKSVDAYKNALRLQPKDIETKQNLAMAMRQMRLQQQQQQQQQQQEKSDEKQDQDQQQQDQEQQQQQQQQQNEAQAPNSDDPSQEKSQQQQDMQEKDLSKDEAQQLLQIMGEEERKVLEKLRKANSKPSKSDKDW